jgi:hypothetical protein
LAFSSGLSFVNLKNNSDVKVFTWCTDRIGALRVHSRISGSPVFLVRDHRGTDMTPPRRIVMERTYTGSSNTPLGGVCATFPFHFCKHCQAVPEVSTTWVIHSTCNDALYWPHCDLLLEWVDSGVIFNIDAVSAPTPSSYNRLIVS